MKYFVYSSIHTCSADDDCVQMCWPAWAAAHSECWLIATSLKPQVKAVQFTSRTEALHLSSVTTKDIISLFHLFNRSLGYIIKSIKEKAKTRGTWCHSQTEGASSSSDNGGQLGTLALCTIMGDNLGLHWHGTSRNQVQPRASLSKCFYPLVTLQKGKF